MLTILSLSDKIQNLHFAVDWLGCTCVDNSDSSHNNLVALDLWPLHQYRVLGRQTDGAKKKSLKKNILISLTFLNV